VNPDVVVDVGNTRIKWGRCAAGRVAQAVALPPEDPAAWQQQRQRWFAAGPRIWVLTGVHPGRRDGLAAWLRAQGEIVCLIDRAAWLPLVVQLERPDHVGIDRLFDAVAANARRRPGRPAVVIDAGSAITVDFLDDAGAFRGGAILPGLRLMAKALHDYTALLPLVEIREPAAPLGTSTPAAVQAGVFWSAVGGIAALIAKHRPAGGEIDCFLSGGDAAVLATGLPADVQIWPEMTLEGIRLTAAILSEQFTG
jgi:type III pantothenate kinase